MKLVSKPRRAIKPKTRIVLDILLAKNAEASRLMDAATRRLEMNEKDKQAFKLSEMAELKFQQSDDVKDLLIKKCFKN